MSACAACIDATANGSGWTGGLLVFGAFLTCPCNLPLSMALLASLGMGPMLVQFGGVVVALLAVLFLVFLGATFTFVLRQRARETARDHEH